MCIFSVFLSGCANEKKLEKAEKEAFLQSGCSGIFVSMYNNSGYMDSMFSEYMGIPTYICKNYFPKNGEKLASFLKEADEESEGEYSYLLLGLDPAKMSCEADEIIALQELFSLNSDITIDIILPVYPYSYWEGLNDGEYEKIKEKYKSVAALTSGYENVFLYFEAEKLWILGNPSCFTEDKNPALKGIVANDFILIDTVFSHNALLSPDTVDSKFEELSANIQTVKEMGISAKAADGDAEEIVFLGDSVFGLYEEPTSIPSVIETFSGKKGYNCGIGGLPITSSAERAGFAELISAVTEDSATGEKWEEFFLSGYVNGSNSEDFKEGRAVCLSGKNPVLFVEMGLNDYFSGFDVKKTEAMFSEDVKLLRERFPDSRIILLVPGYIATPNFGHGENPVFEGGGNLEEYREIIRGVGNEQGLELIELCDFSFITEENCAEYLDYNGIHYNELGRFLLGTELARYLEE